MLSTQSIAAIAFEDATALSHVLLNSVKAHPAYILSSPSFNEADPEDAVEALAEAAAVGEQAPSPASTSGALTITTSGGVSGENNATDTNAVASPQQSQHEAAQVRPNHT